MVYNPQETVTVVPCLSEEQGPASEMMEGLGFRTWPGELSSSLWKMGLV